MDHVVENGVLCFIHGSGDSWHKPHAGALVRLLGMDHVVENSVLCLSTAQEIHGTNG
jgi:hypothetical protein